MNDNETDPLVTFQTSVHWAFAVPEASEPQPSWGGTRHQSDFLPGQRLQVPRSVGEAREQAGLGKIIT